MSARHFLLIGAAFVLGWFTLLLLWPASRKPAGGLSVRFVGLTNDTTGSQLAQFRVANHCSRRVRAGVCEVQLYQTNGWPDWYRVAGGAAWLPVAAGRERVFSVPVPLMEGANWRVPLPYQEDLSIIDNVRFRIDGLAWAIPRWHPGSPAPVRHGDSFHRTLIAYGPEMLGVSNPAVQRTEASRSADQRNPSPGAAGFRR